MDPRHTESFAHYQRVLRRSLFRFDCPDPHTLGEHQLSMLDDAHGRRIDAHAAECEECRRELDMLRLLVSSLSSV